MRKETHYRALSEIHKYQTALTKAKTAMEYEIDV